MKGFLLVFNLFGVVVLAGLCLIQWQVNSRVNLRANQLEAVRQSQQQTLLENDRTIKGQAADLEEFRQRLQLAESQLKEMQIKIDRAAVEQKQLTAERDQYKAALPKWAAAVTARDAAIKKAVVEIQSLATQRDDAIAKLNDVVTKYNALVKASG